MYSTSKDSPPLGHLSWDAYFKSPAGQAMLASIQAERTPVIATAAINRGVDNVRPFTSGQTAALVGIGTHELSVR